MHAEVIERRHTPRHDEIHANRHAPIESHLRIIAHTSSDLRVRANSPPGGTRGAAHWPTRFDQWPRQGLPNQLIGQQRALAAAAAAAAAAATEINFAIFPGTEAGNKKIPLAAKGKN